MDIVVPGGMPLIIDDELFQKVQEVTTTKKNPYQNTRRRTKNGLYLLTGKLFCGKCGAAMTGISGTARDGNLKFYYVCQNKRTKHSCDKKNVPRDWIENKVAEAITNFVLTDETIDWIADMAVEYSKNAVEASDLNILYSQLSDVERSLANIMKAIEAGIITETTKDRMKELEAERTKLRYKIADEKSNTVELSKDDIVAGLMMFRDGDINDQTFRMKLFDTFIKAVYIFDDNLKIVFSFSGDKNTISVPLEIENECEDVSINDTGANRLSSRLVQSTVLKRTASIWFRNGDFLLVVPLCEYDLV